ncbi:hypothetical protein AZE42_06664 [Rhizopogon vesiculosus]|uniref:F-box domain-containing protein n=1 Tax=Rhizopogon vesiculosus TaxID=180088 RepID=A0A1J8PP62_9AGAM|nr:hypothetical protein AZE42_06664 [Rhizopogon vesiculosus]
MQELGLEEATAKSDVNIMPASDIIDALQNILEHSRLMIPDLETTYSKSPNPNQYQASQLKEQPESINAILTERREQLNTVLRNIPALNTIMIKIKDLRQQLVGEQHKIVHSMTLHRGYKSALWRLPVEVLNQIFIHCLPKTDCWWISPEVAPILLTKICRKWREVAVNLPSLWCRLLVGGYGARQKTAFCYESWLKRSRRHPLSLQIHYVPKDITMIQTLLQPYTNQISSLQIILEDIYSQPLFLPNLPALRELTLDGPVSYSFIGSFSCPRLRNFKLKAFVADPVRIQWPSCDVWFHLTNLEINVERSHQCLHLLYQCPNLSFFTTFPPESATDYAGVSISLTFTIVGAIDLAPAELQFCHCVTRFNDLTNNQQPTQRPTYIALTNKMHVYELEDAPANSVVPASDIIDALQNILERLQLMVRLF